MKTLLPLLALILMSSTSHAVIADRFSCKMKITDRSTGASTEKEQDFYVARIPLSTSPAPDVRLTAGQTQTKLALETPKATMSAHVNFYYKHAVKIDSAGNSTEARQMSCMGLSGSYCPKNGTGLQLCSDGVVQCMEFSDPFDPVKGWNPTSLIGNMPAFNERALGAITAIIRDDNSQDVGTINFECKYQGSFE